jgi:hypothetical protein
MMNNPMTRLVARVLRPLCRRVVASRPPDRVIGRSGGGGVYLRRWFLVPRNRFCNVYLHLFFRDDPDVPHDHPWPSLSLSLDKGLVEWYGPEGGNLRLVVPGDLVFRGATFAHRLQVPYRGAMTIFITGPRVRSWGFHCGKDTPAGGWRHWRDFTDPVNPGEVGRGCD